MLSVAKIDAPQDADIDFSFDIACSYSKKFSERMRRYPEAQELHLDNRSIRWAVPKFHLHAHGPSCQCRFSWNYMHGAGRTHGEIVETGWSMLNPAALSSREMAPHTRHEFLGSVMGTINWNKITSSGT